MALPSSSRFGATVIWVTLHTAEGSRTKEDLYAFFNRNQNASSHVGIDGRGFTDWVPRERAAWTLLNGNPISVNAELCGFARWTREQWLSEGWVDGCWNPRAMVRHAAQWAKRECEALGIPKRYIGINGVRNRERGVIIHWDYSRGTGDGDHWDTGWNFPWDVFFADMNPTPVPAPAPAPVPVNHKPKGDTMFIKNLDTGAYGIYSGGVLSGIDGANAEATNREGGGGNLVGVSNTEWEDYVQKSRNLENLNANLAAVTERLDKLITLTEALVLGDHS